MVLASLTGDEGGDGEGGSVWVAVVLSSVRAGVEGSVCVAVVVSSGLSTSRSTWANAMLA